MEPKLKNPDMAAGIKDLNVSFRGLHILKDVSALIPGNGITVLIGPSGSGKTSFLRALNRLNECYPGMETNGDVQLYLNGNYQNVYGKDFSVSELRRKVGMVFQHPNVLPVSIEKNIALPLRLVREIRKSDTWEITNRVLEETLLWDEVKDRLGDSAANLSGGQQQRLCLARTLALEPEILLLDEPTSSLDFRATQKMEDLIRQLKKRYRIIAVSHSLSQARRIADRILVFKSGTIVRTLDKRELDLPETLQSLVEEYF